MLQLKPVTLRPLYCFLAPAARPTTPTHSTTRKKKTHSFNDSLYRALMCYFPRHIIIFYCFVIYLHSLAPQREGFTAPSSPQPHSPPLRTSPTHPHPPTGAPGQHRSLSPTPQPTPPSSVYPDTLPLHLHGLFANQLQRAHYILWKGRK